MTLRFRKFCYHQTYCHLYNMHTFQIGIEIRLPSILASGFIVRDY